MIQAMSQDILKRVLKSPRLPSLPTVAIDVINLVMQEDVKIEDIANAIRHDPALASKILKAVNSGFYGQSGISTISQALVILGLNSVKALALGFTLINNISAVADDGLDNMGFWRRSAYAASASRTLARQVGLKQHEEAFIGGLLQNLGILAMRQTLGEAYVSILTEIRTEHHNFVSLEQDELQTDHAQVGAALLEHWNLPPLLVEPIRFHETPDGAPDDLAQMISCAFVGGRVADVFMSVEPGEALDIYYRLAEQRLNIDRDQAEPLLKQIHTDTAEIKRLFSLPTGDLGNSDAILAVANEALLEINLQQEQQTAALVQEHSHLVEETLMDGLTGVGNRRHFDEFIARQFGIAQTDSTDLSVLLMDADHFKRLNDTHGHPTGDRVLVEMAHAIRARAPEHALVARYGGEEFAVVLPGSDLRSAVRLAESIRKAIESTQVDTDTGQPLSITISIGVATYDAKLFDDPKHLLKVADQTLYAAKAAGRNCVRIFASRVPKLVA